MKLLQHQVRSPQHHLLAVCVVAAAAAAAAAGHRLPLSLLFSSLLNLCMPFFPPSTRTATALPSLYTHCKCWKHCPISAAAAAAVFPYRCNCPAGVPSIQGHLTPRHAAHQQGGVRILATDHVLQQDIGVLPPYRPLYSSCISHTQ